MRIAIIHYHLGQGGVARVIEATSKLLTSIRIRHVILTSDDQAPLVPELPVRFIAGLGYSKSECSLSAHALLASMRSAAKDALGGPPDIWHFHNHSLGKNRLIADVVARLAEEQERLILQIHDLAEDGRACNYQLIANCRNLYPISPRVHYAFLNSRDLGIFINARLPPERGDVLTNPIVLPVARPAAAAVPAPPALLFAPVRGIRRKNLGELVFLSALAPAGVRFAVSRAPFNPAALPVHDDWQNFSTMHRLPIDFNVVDRLSPVPGESGNFESWLAHATHFVTTSVAEGFGLTFLESVAHGKPLIGRSLSHTNGVNAGELYERLLIPADWIDADLLRSHLTAALERNYSNYRRPLPKQTITATLDLLDHSGYLDFSNLPESLQQTAIEKLFSPDLRKLPLVQIRGETHPAESWLADAIANRTVSTTSDPCYPSNYADKLTQLYTKLARQPEAAVWYIAKAEILSACLTPESFNFLLSSPEPRQQPTYRAVIFDIYGTLLILPHGKIKPASAIDPLLRKILRDFGYMPPHSPSSELHAAVLRHHANAAVPFPEVDLRVLWRGILALQPDTEITRLVETIEAAWRPAKPMPGAEAIITRLSESGIQLGLLSNAQCNTLGSLGELANLFAPELTILSYQHGLAKPATELFQMLTTRLADRGISPSETLYIGNDPRQDIVPAAAAGFRTALFTGHPDSFRAGDCTPDHTLLSWEELAPLI